MYLGGFITINTIVCGAVLLVLLTIVGSSTLLEKRALISPSANRSMVHIIVGLLVSVFPFLFTSAAYAIGLGITFSLLNAISLIRDRSQGMHGSSQGVKHGSFGTIWFPIAFTLLCVIFWNTPEIITISMLILALADPIASFVGQRYGKNSSTLWMEKKSLEGSLAFFATTFIILSIGVQVVSPEFNAYTIVLELLAIAVLITASESLSWRGSDNITVPLITAFAWYILFYSPAGLYFTAWITLSFLTSIIAYKKKWLTINGSISALLVGTFIGGLGGLQWAIPLYTFFITSSLISKLKRSVLNTPHDDSKGRTMYQVFANGGAASVLAVANFIYPLPILYLAFIVLLAGATADTWSSEIGKLSKRRPIHMVSGKRVPHGTSGAVTLLGWCSAGVGASVIALSAQLPWSITSLVCVAGVLIAGIDSLLGATIQADEPLSGFGTLRIPGITNNAVNVLSTISGTLLVMIVVGLAL